MKAMVIMDNQKEETTVSSFTHSFTDDNNLDTAIRNWKRYVKDVSIQVYRELNYIPVRQAILLIYSDKEIRRIVSIAFR